MHIYNMEQCSSAVGVRKGAWTREEDGLLKRCIDKYGQGKWHLVPSRAGLNRCRKSCRLRWMNYLKPDIKRGEFSVDEVDLILRLHKLLGNRWSLIAGRIPGRTANDVKNYWNTHLRKKGLLSYDNINPKNTDTIDSQNIIIKTKVIKPRPRTFRKQIVYVNPNPKAVLSQEDRAPVVLTRSPEESNYWWESLLENNGTCDQGNMINSLLSSNNIDHDHDHDYGFDVSEPNKDVGCVSNAGFGETDLPLVGSPTNKNNSSNYSHDNDNDNDNERCVENGNNDCWIDFIMDVDLWDVTV